jgi:hypothetical protein
MQPLTPKKNIIRVATYDLLFLPVLYFVRDIIIIIIIIIMHVH